MKVCIAEKPSVAREIASVLGANTKRDGFFEGNGYAVTYTFGHLCTLFEPKDYKPHWKSWDLNNLPMLPEKFETKVTTNQGVQKQFNTIKKLLDKAALVINCGDAGQEGELIQRWVINQANYNGDIQRLWISSLTTEAIKEGFNNLKSSELYDNLYYAGFSRAICDWILGLNATRLYTVKHGGYKQVLSVGRVQTPTLAMLVNRYNEIQNFKPQPYWELQTNYRNTLFSYEEGRFLKKEDGEVLASRVKESDFKITEVSKKKGKEYAPKLFDLTGLQVYCNTKFGFTADETLKMVQKLYEQKLVTYPRVDTTFLPSDVYPKVPGILKKLTKYSDLTNVLLNKKIKKSTRVFNDKKITDHHAIIPTGVQSRLQYNQQQIYDIICKRFIAVFYNDCDISRTSVTGEAASIVFKTTGKEILKKGWRIVFEFPTINSGSQSIEKNVKMEDNDGSVTDSEVALEMPTFTKGETGNHEPSFLEKETKPPRYFTEASLLRAMETAGKHVDDDEMRELMKENGIGRPSTRASIIETLFKRKYVERKKKLLIPTTTGIQLIEVIKNELLKSAELTGQWEKKLKEIEKGTYNAGTFIKDMKQMVDQLVYEVRSEQSNVKISHSSLKNNTQAVKKETLKGIVGLVCPQCKKGHLLKGKTAFGCSAYKENCNFKLSFTFLDKKISENQYIRLVKKGATVNLKGFQTENGKSEGAIVFDKQFNLCLNKKETPNKDTILCPKCKKGTVIKGKTAYGCSAYKEGCGFRFSFDKIRQEANGKALTRDLVLELLNNYLIT